MDQQQSMIEELERYCVKDDSKKFAEAVQAAAFRDLHHRSYHNEKNDRGWESVGAYLLSVAVKENAIECVKIMLRFVRVDNIDNVEQSVLHHVGNGEIAKVLISAGFSVNARDKMGHSPMHSAVWTSEVQTLAVLCGTAGAQINMDDDASMTPLQHAVEGHHPGCVSTLLSFGARTDIVDGWSGETLRELAVRKGYDDIVLLFDEERLLSEDAEVKTAGQRDTGSAAEVCPRRVPATVPRPRAKRRHSTLPADAAVKSQYQSKYQLLGPEPRAKRRVSTPPTDPVEVFDTPLGRAFYGWCLRLDMGSFRNQALIWGAVTFRQQSTLMALAGSGPEVHNAKLLDMVAEGGTLEKYRALAETVKALGHPDTYTQFMTLLKG